MTSTNTGIDTVVPATNGGETTNTSKASKKLLRISSEAHKRPARNSLRAANCKLTLKSASTNAPIISATSGAAAEHPRQTKAVVVEGLLSREGGASLEVLCGATGWQPHTCRAFLTGLRKKGKQVIRASDKDGKSIYLIALDQSPAPLPTPEQAEAESN